MATTKKDEDQEFQGYRGFSDYKGYEGLSGYSGMPGLPVSEEARSKIMAEVERHRPPLRIQTSYRWFLLTCFLVGLGLALFILAFLLR